MIGEGSAVESVRYRPIEGIEHYRIGEDGSGWSRLVRGSKRRSLGEWSPIKAHANPKSGHLYFRLTINGKTVKRYVHRVVLESFVGPCPKGMECLHQDGNPRNCNLGNLRWGTRKENCADTAAHGRAYRGDRHFLAKLRESDIEAIHEIKKTNPKATSVDLGILFGVSESTIRAVLKGRNWAWTND